jgi:hypothetical protein
VCCDEKPDRKNTTTQRTGPFVSICKIKSAQECLLASAVHLGSGVRISLQCVIDKSGFRERRESGRDRAQYLNNRATLCFVQDCKLLENVLLVMPEDLIYFGVTVVDANDISEKIHQRKFLVPRVRAKFPHNDLTDRLEMPSPRDQSYVANVDLSPSLLIIEGRSAPHDFSVRTQFRQIGALMSLQILTGVLDLDGKLIDDLFSLIWFLLLRVR